MGVEADLMRKSRKMKMTSSWMQGVLGREGEHSGDGFGALSRWRRGGRKLVIHSVVRQSIWFGSMPASFS
jgi:hypothetical protein